MKNLLLQFCEKFKGVKQDQLVIYDSEVIYNVNLNENILEIKCNSVENGILITIEVIDDDFANVCWLKDNFSLAKDIKQIKEFFEEFEIFEYKNNLSV